MDWSAALIFGIEIIGTIVFSIAGGLIAIERNLDYFGIIVLSVTTAVGGGMTRDIILGLTPPAMFLHPVYVLAALASSVFLILLLNRYGNFVGNGAYTSFMKPIVFCDALGLGIFTVVGMRTAFDAGYDENAFLCVFVGVLTGIGGGMLRDLFVHRIPLVFRREIYAIASIIGAVAYYFLRIVLNDSVAMLAGAGVIVAIRLLSVRFRWNLPQARL